jgi:AcrR family transcriptional regulator
MTAAFLMMPADITLRPKTAPVRSLAKVPCFGALDDTPRGRILRASCHLFRVHGFGQATVRQIAALVGIQSGSLFHHFRSKEDMLYNILREVLIHNTMAARAICAEEMDPRRRVRRMILAELAAFHGVTRDAMTLLSEELHRISPAHRDELAALRESYEACWLSALSALPPQSPAPAGPGLRRALLHGAMAWTQNWDRADGEQPLQVLAEELLAMAGG